MKNRESFQQVNQVPKNLDTVERGRRIFDSFSSTADSAQRKVSRIFLPSINPAKTKFGIFLAQGC
jgi:hypothetical protein